MGDFAKVILSALSVIVLAGAIVFLSLVVDKNFNNYISIRQQENKNNAIQECYKASTTEYQTKDGAKVIEPVRIFYKRCVEDKGYTTSVDTNS